MFLVFGYDKLKPYGFSIYERVDGVSRSYMVYLFLNSVEELKVCLNIFKTYCGSENGIMASVHNDVMPTDMM